MRIGRIVRCPSLLSAAVAVTFGLAASPATAAAPVPGATYTGPTSEYSLAYNWYSTVQFTVSGDGTSVTSVVLRYVQLWKADGSVYGYVEEMTGDGSAPIVNGAFEVAVGGGGAVDRRGSYFKGSFTGPQSAAGTLYVHESRTETIIIFWPPLSRVVTDASHVLTWTATVQPVVGEPPPPPPQMPTTKQQCKESWRLYKTVEGKQIFKNQGDCVSYVATSHKNLPDG